MATSLQLLFFVGEVKWKAGFFDRGSFMETLDNWAQTVVTGRARLGGIPCGVIAVETRTVECVIPADPANPDTESRVRTLFVVYIVVCLLQCLLSVRLLVRQGRSGTQTPPSRQPRQLVIWIARDFPFLSSLIGEDFLEE